MSEICFPSDLYKTYNVTLPKILTMYIFVDLWYFIHIVLSYTMERCQNMFLGLKEQILTMLFLKEFSIYNCFK